MPAGPATTEAALDAPLPFALIPGSVTNDQAARDAYRLAMQELGASGPSAEHHLDEAIARDPAFASAHLQRAYIEYRQASPELEVMRRNLSQAAATKGALSARDAELLDAITPASSDPQDWAEVQRRLRAMTARRSGDTQLWEALALALAKSSSTSEEAIRAFERVATLDATASFALGLEAQMGLAQGDETQARRSLDECIRRAPADVGCRYTMLGILAAGGDCEALDRAARQMVASAPDSPVGYEFRARAQAGLRAPVETVEALLAQRRARQSAPYRAASERVDEIRLAIWNGDFAAAAERAELAEKTGSAKEVPAARQFRIYALREMGESQEAGSLALDMLHRAPAFPRDDELADDWTIWMLVAAHRVGALPDADFERQRDEWNGAWRARLGTDAWRASAPLAWWYGYAQAADTARSAQDALAHLADFGPLPRAGNTLFVSHDTAIGETYRLAGELDEAAARLEAATRVCALPSITIAITPAYLGLGRLREARGDVSGACGAYAQVLAAWGQARPRSITADGARAGAARLHCSAR
jgi:tetratricopeptide (TPR) repeat protein